MYPKKRFGQHFLREQAVLDKIVAVIAPDKDDQMVEIGPGGGALTVCLLAHVSNLAVVEIDPELIPKLQQKCQSFGTLNIYQQDVLNFDFTKLTQKPHTLRVVGNLPYNISTPLIFHILNQLTYIKDMHFMLQKEVAQRLIATPGSKRYGRLSVMIQYFCEVELLFEVKPEAFYPMPKVDSAVVRLIPRPPKVIAKDINHLEKIVKQAFSQRRKTIHNSLKGIITAAQFASLNIDPNLRAEQLTVEQFVELSNIQDA